MLKLTQGAQVVSKNDLVDDFNGHYSDSGSGTSYFYSQGSEEDDDDDDEEYEGESEDASENSEEQRKKKQKSNKKKRPKATSTTYGQKQTTLPKKKHRIIFNCAETRYSVIRYVAKKIFGWKLDYEPESTDFDVQWIDNFITIEHLSKLEHHQKINHFPGMYSIARKNHLSRNLMKLKREYPDDFKFMPQTWNLPSEYLEFKQSFDRIPRGKARTFIVKPEAGCQGRGIFLTRSLDDIDPKEHYVVQRYLHKPHLIEGLKYDLRLYVLVAGCDPLRIYLYKEGLARFATEEYEPPNRENLDDLCMHLTNYAINKDNPNFQFNEDEEQADVGHKRSVTSILKMLEDEGHAVGDLWQEIRDIVVKTICSGQPVIAHEYKTAQPDNYMNNMCFELLGLDIILDHKLKPYILEVNHQPSFATDTPLDSQIKKSAIKDSLQIMNINTKTKIKTILQRREEKQKRVLTGKKVRLTLEEKQAEILRCQKLRDEWEDENMGNFEKLYPPSEGQENFYIKYIESAQRLYEEQTGAHIKRNTKKYTYDNIQSRGSVSYSTTANGFPHRGNASQRKSVKDIDSLYSQRNVNMMKQNIKNQIYNSRTVPSGGLPNVNSGAKSQNIEIYQQIQTNKENQKKQQQSIKSAKKNSNNALNQTEEEEEEFSSADEEEPSLLAMVLNSANHLAAMSQNSIETNMKQEDQIQQQQKQQFQQQQQQPKLGTNINATNQQLNNSTGKPMQSSNGFRIKKTTHQHKSSYNKSTPLQKIVETNSNTNISYKPPLNGQQLDKHKQNNTTTKKSQNMPELQPSLMNNQSSTQNSSQQDTQSTQQSSLQRERPESQQLPPTQQSPQKPRSVQNTQNSGERKSVQPNLNNNIRVNSANPVKNFIQSNIQKAKFSTKSTPQQGGKHVSVVSNLEEQEILQKKFAHYMLDNNNKNSSSSTSKNENGLLKKSDYVGKKPMKTMIISKNSSISYSTQTGPHSHHPSLLEPNETDFYRKRPPSNSQIQQYQQQQQNGGYNIIHPHNRYKQKSSTGGSGRTTQSLSQQNHKIQNTINQNRLKQQQAPTISSIMGSNNYFTQSSKPTTSQESTSNQKKNIHNILNVHREYYRQHAKSGHNSGGNTGGSQKSSENVVYPSINKKEGGMQSSGSKRVVQSDGKQLQKGFSKSKNSGGLDYKKKKEENEMIDVKQFGDMQMNSIIKQEDIPDRNINNEKGPLSSYSNFAIINPQQLQINNSQNQNVGENNNNNH